jgi:hypothetical protein
MCSQLKPISGAGAARGRDRHGTGLDLRNREAQGSEAAGDRDRVA